MRMLTVGMMAAFGFVTQTMAAAPTLPEDYAPPALSMQQAVTLATQCLVAKDPDMKKLYLQTATFLPTRQLNRTGADRGRQWMITWQRPDTPIGGQTTVNIYEDRSCVIGFGE